VTPYQTVLASKRPQRWGRLAQHDQPGERSWPAHWGHAMRPPPPQAAGKLPEGCLAAALARRYASRS